MNCRGRQKTAKHPQMPSMSGSLSLLAFWTQQQAHTLMVSSFNVLVLN
jgi:hypothetical protein